MTETIDVLLATYNGARFLPDLLRSIEGQTHSGWRLLVRDDASNDRSPTIIEEFAQRHGERVRVLRDGRGQLGACGNFGALLAASDAPYFLFCDQDDVWLPEKIAGLRRALRQVEERRGAEVPILVHSDLVVVDGALRVVHPSFWRYTRLLDPTAPRRPARLIVQNYVTGCASIGNAALRRAALPIPKEARVHDWWVALVAAVRGEIAEHDAATILYRQHHYNEIGAKPGDLPGIVSQFLRAPLFELKKGYLAIAKSQQQAAALLKYSHDDNRMTRISLEFSRLRQGSWWQRKSFLFRHNILPDYWLKTVTLWWFL